MFLEANKTKGVKELKNDHFSTKLKEVIFTI